MNKKPLKHRVTKLYNRLFWVIIIFGAIGVAIFIVGTDGSVYALSFLLLSIFLIIAGIYKQFFDLGSATFSMDSEGISFFTGFRKYRLLWDECVDCGIVNIDVNQGIDTYWVYCSNKMLSPAEKRDFLRKTRFHLDQNLYYQYQEGLFEEMLSYLSEDMRQKLLQAKQMNGIS